MGSTRVEEFFEMMPRRYFVSHTPRQIARHARVVLSLRPEAGHASAVRMMRGGFSEYILCTRDVTRLYADVAGCLTAVDINILGSNVYTTRTGLALEVYRVTTPAGEESDRDVRWADLEALLQRVLRGEVDIEERLRSRGRPYGRATAPVPRPSRVQIRNDVSDFYTVIDVTANDRPGLLFDLTRTLAGHDLEIFISKASTVLDQVADTFYVKGPGAKKVVDPEKVARIEDELRQVVGGEVAGAP
ncbi:MAG: hypothetical protein CL910_10835 [Deltaproteobacteria bacterium]|nr:hypothetical protein [Deltaproteobacteria bacterium]